MYILYSLIDPRENKVRYIGYTKNPSYKRLASHIYEGKSKTGSHKRHWIKALDSLNLKPTLKVLCSVNNIELAHKLEIELINHYSRFCKLTNNTKGGEGANGLKHTQKTIDKIKESIKRSNRQPYLRTKEHRNQISQRCRLGVRAISWLTGEEKEFKDKIEASKYMECSLVSISQASSGMRSSVNNWTIEIIKKK